jgi:phosphatidylglycerol:prolipoprotein diacylglycerol transferase
MYPILGRYGPFFLYSYTVVMGLAIAAGIGLTAWLEKRDSIARPGWIDGLLVALVAALVGGRIGFVLANQAYFLEQPDEIGLVWRGGLSYHGVLLAGLAALWFWTIWRRRPFGFYAGLLAPAIALVSAFGWVACWFEGCAYGRETVIGPLAADLPDSFGVYALRYQTQILGIVLSLLVLGFILALRRRFRTGLLFWITLLLLSASRLLINLLRGDEAPYLGTFRLDLLAEVTLLVICLIAAVGSYGRPGTSTDIE